MPFAPMTQGGHDQCGRRLPGVASIFMTESTGDSSYNALQVWVNRRFSDRLAFQAAYTWSHAITNVPLAAFNPLDRSLQLRSRPW